MHGKDDVTKEGVWVGEKFSIAASDINVTVNTNPNF